MNNYESILFEKKYKFNISISFYSIDFVNFFLIINNQEYY